MSLFSGMLSHPQAVGCYFASLLTAKENNSQQLGKVRRNGSSSNLDTGTVCDGGGLREGLDS